MNRRQRLDFYSVNDPYGEFSNFAAFPIRLDGQTWPTSEHYFQALKFQDEEHAIDRAIATRLEKENIKPAPSCSDAEFHRRVLLDIAGRIPTPPATRAFLASESKTKRDELIDTLLSRREMPIYWSRVLAGWLMNGGNRRNEQFLKYRRRGLDKKKSWDALARDMLLARPERPDHYATLFLSSRADQIKARTIGGDIGRAFFRVNLRCAQCHDHPNVPEWKQAHAYGLAAFFGRSFAASYKDKTTSPSR